MRTALTMLGVIIGVASVVALVSVGQGATKGISDQLQGLGTNLLTVNPGLHRPARHARLRGSATTLTIDDAQRDRRARRGPIRRAGALDQQARRRRHPERDDHDHRHDRRLPDRLRLQTVDRAPSSTRRPSTTTCGSRSSGATTADNLGLTDSSIGSTIYIGGLPFQLVGILQAKGGHRSPPGRPGPGAVSRRRASCSSATGPHDRDQRGRAQDRSTTVSAEITALLEQRHGIAAGHDDFTIATRPSC
jgi:putative ABC transport system permease protein